MKAASPEKFAGDRKQVRNFLTQVELALHLNESKYSTDKAKILFAITFFKDQALNWIRPMLEEYLLIRNNESWGQQTRDTFSSYRDFVRAVNKTFEDTDEIRVAERGLQNLKQLGSMTAYNAKFQQHAFIAGWNETALAAAYHAGLRDEIKYAIAIKGKPVLLDDLRTMATDIGNALYEQRMDRKGKPAVYGVGRTNRSKPEGDPMELDAIEDNSGKTRIKCYSCGKIGHKKRDCVNKLKTIEALELHKEKKTSGFVDLDELYRQQEDKHGSLSWTACYDDGCQIHLSGKEGSGWFPKQVSKRRRKNRRSLTPYPGERIATEQDTAYEDMIERTNEWTRNMDPREPTRDHKIWRTPPFTNRPPTAVLRTLIRGKEVPALIEPGRVTDLITSTLVIELSIQTQDKGNGTETEELEISTPQGNRYKKTFRVRRSVFKYIVLGNSQKEAQQSKQAIFEDRAVEQRFHPKLEPQTIAAVAWYNYYRPRVPGHQICGRDITNFDKELKGEANIEETVLFKILQHQQCYVGWVAEDNIGPMGEPFSWSQYFTTTQEQGEKPQEIKSATQAAISSSDKPKKGSNIVRDETSEGSDETSKEKAGMSKDGTVERRDSTVEAEGGQDIEPTEDTGGQRTDRELESEPWGDNSSEGWDVMETDSACSIASISDISV